MCGAMGSEQEGEWGFLLPPRADAPRTRSHSISWRLGEVMWLSPFYKATKAQGSRVTSDLHPANGGHI